MLSVIIGLFIVIGCGSSKETQKMSDFIKEYSETVDEYTDFFNKGEKEKCAEIEVKVKSFMSKWGELKMELSDEVTPQVLNKMDQEFQNISAKYNKLVGKS
jgi:hypothetical protein